MSKTFKTTIATILVSIVMLLTFNSIVNASATNPSEKINYYLGMNGDEAVVVGELLDTDSTYSGTTPLKGIGDFTNETLTKIQKKYTFDGWQLIDASEPTNLLSIVGTVDAGTTVNDAIRGKAIAGGFAAVAKWKLNEYTLTVNSTVENGTITASADKVNHGSECYVIAKANPGYKVSMKITVDGTEIKKGTDYTETITAEGNKYTIPAEKVTGNIVATASFADKYVATVNSPVDNGTIEAAKTVAYGKEFKITATPNTGYEVDTMKITVGKTVLTEDDYTVSGNVYTVKAEKAIENINAVVSFKKQTYTVTVNSDVENGTISAAETVKYNDPCTITIVPDYGYEIDTLTITEGGKTLVEGVDYTVEGDEYTIEHATANINAEVSYKKLPFDIKVVCDDNATVLPSDPIITIHYNESQILKINAKEGYELLSVTVNGEEQLPLRGDELEIANIAEDKTVVVTVKKIKLNITTSVKGGNGTVTETQEVEYGNNFEITFTPDVGYMIDTVTIDGYAVVTDGNVYTLKNVKKPYDIVVSYKKLPFDLTVKSVEGATVDPVGTITVYYGDNKTVNIKANEGYILVGVTVNGEEQELPLDNDEVVLSNITDDMTVEVKVEKETYVVVEGADQTVEEEKDLVVRFSGDLNKFVRLYVDGVLVDEKNYTKESGSTIITLNKEYLATLKAGKHTLVAEYSNGNTAETTFIIEDKDANPNTGDNIILYVAILVIAIVGIVVIKKMNKKEYKK